MLSDVTELPTEAPPEAPPEAPEELLTVDGVAEVLKISFIAARRLVMGGEITSVKIGRLRRVRRSDLNTFMANLI